MAHLLFGKPSAGLVWDHKDRNFHNMQRANVRIATVTQNTHNSLRKRKVNSWGATGVSLDGKKYRARISNNGVQVDIGYFDTLEEAGEAYKQAAMKIHGEFYHACTK